MKTIIIAITVLLIDLIVFFCHDGVNHDSNIFILFTVRQIIFFVGSRILMLITWAHGVTRTQSDTNHSIESTFR